MILTLTIHARCHSGQCYHYIETILLIWSANGFYTIITLLILDTTFSYIIFDFVKDILHPFPQLFNLGRFISQKHNNEDINRKITQQQHISVIITLTFHRSLITERKQLQLKGLLPVKLHSQPSL